MNADTLVRCSVCKAERVVWFAVCLRNGWPKCHGYTMTMIDTTADVGAAAKDVLRSQSAEPVR